MSHSTVEVMHSMKVKHSKLKKETLKALPEPSQDHYQNTLPQTGTVVGVAKHLETHAIILSNDNLVKLQRRRGDMVKTDKSWKKNLFFPIKYLVVKSAPIRMIQ